MLLPVHLPPPPLPPHVHLHLLQCTRPWQLGARSTRCSAAMYAQRASDTDPTAARPCRRPIWALEISDRPGQAEAEPAVK